MNAATLVTTYADLPELSSTEINDACWAFVEAMPHRLPGPIWNNLKPAVYAAVCKFLQVAPKAASGIGNSGFDHQTAADFLNGKAVSDESVRKFVHASRLAHDERAYLSAMLLSVRCDLASREAEIALLKKALIEAEAAPQQEPAGEVVSASCDHATVRWLHQTSSVGGGDPRNSRSWPITGDKVYLAPQQEAPDSGSCTDGNTPGLMPADAELLAHIKEAVPGLTRVNTALMVAKAVLEKFGSRRVASEVK